jgi:hypothetical protein
MTAAAAQGPIARSALVASRPRFPTKPSEAARARIGARRQIGSGSRGIIVTRPARTAPRRISHAPTARTMQRPTLYVTSFLVLVFASLAAVGINAAVDTPRTLMAPADYHVAKRAIENETRLALGRCRDAQGGAKDVCKAEVRAEERVKKADLAARYHGTVSAAQDARQARVKAQYDVARARCGSRLADDKLDCLRAAREERNRSLAEAAPAAT